MSTVPDNLEELIERIGGVPLHRICTRPAPGTATEEDVAAALDAANKRLYELVDGVLVEKPMGTKEGLLAGLILHRFWAYLEDHDLGQAFGADSAMRLLPGLVRIPDVSFVSWEHLPEGVPDTPLASLAPDLAVEVISKSNTRGEIKRKLADYFLAGSKLVWVIQPKTGTAEVYTAPDRKKRVPNAGTLDGNDVLPGFKLSLQKLFARANKKPPKRSR